MTTVTDALELWYSACEKASCPERLKTVRLPLAEAAGLVTAQSVWALGSSPPFDASAMDGIAVHSPQTKGATEDVPARIGVGEFEVVDTGDPLPEGFDAVVMREHVHVADGIAHVCSEVGPYQNVRSIGEDIVANELLLFEGHRLRPVDLAACGAAGVTEVLVRQRPVVAVLPTGDEIRPVGSALARGQFYDTNSIMLAAQAREIGCEAVVLPIEADDPQGIARAVRKAVAICDLLIIIAGASVGRDDYTAQVIERLGVLAVHGVALRPGHPVMLGAVDATPILGAPGYPVSAAISFEVFAAPLIARLEGTMGQGRPRCRAQLAHEVTSPVDTDEWVRVRLGRVNDRLMAAALPRGAGVLTSLVRADGLLWVPAGSRGNDAGAEVEISLLRDPAEIEGTIVAMGSNDLALDLAASALRGADVGRSLATWSPGFRAGLSGLREGLCHLAGVAHLGPLTGQSQLDEISDAVEGLKLAAVRLAVRQQGLMVAPANPLAIGGIADLARDDVRYVNRQLGSVTRALLERELERLGIAQSSVTGYKREEGTHLAVAAAVASGRCDCGLGLLAAARAFGLGFIPLWTECYDLVLDANMVETELLAPLWHLLSSPAFQAAVRALGGYDTSETGMRMF